MDMDMDMWAVQQAKKVNALVTTWIHPTGCFVSWVVGDRFGQMSCRSVRARAAPEEAYTQVRYATLQTSQLRKLALLNTASVVSTDEYDRARHCDCLACALWRYSNPEGACEWGSNRSDGGGRVQR